MRKLFQLPRAIGWRDNLFGALLAFGVIVWLVSTASAIGFMRDEGFYFHAATRYAEWFGLLWENPSEAIDRKMIDRFWSYNHEHPSLIKSLFSLSWLCLHKRWQVFHNASDAFRFPAIVLSGVTVWVVYLFGARVYGRRAGLVAALLFLLMPRVFFHAHLACFDVPVVAMWTLCIYVYWRSVERGGIGWAIVAGVVFGLTLDTKHNAWILPGVLAPHALCILLSHQQKEWIKRLFRVSYGLVTMAVVGPLVFWALWPWMWHDTVPRLREYFNFHFNHVYYNMEFLGTNYFSAPSPRSYMPIMILATVPTITLLLCAVGGVNQARRAFAWMKRWRSQTPDSSVQLETHPSLLFGLAALAAISPWLLLAKTPIFGGTKHWMTAYPFIALFAAHGLDQILDSVGAAMERLPRWALTVAKAGVTILVIAGPLAITIHAHPFGLSSYVPLVGGTKGGASFGLNRQFWGYTTQNAGEQFLNKNAPFASPIFFHDTAWESWGRMLDEHRVRHDLRGVAAPHQSRFALIQHELHMNEVEFQIWVAFQTRTPVFIVTHDEVPIVSVYCNQTNPHASCISPFN